LLAASASSEAVEMKRFHRRWRGKDWRGRKGVKDRSRKPEGEDRFGGGCQEEGGRGEVEAGG
jgi:hypothetical protein